MLDALTSTIHIPSRVLPLDDLSTVKHTDSLVYQYSRPMAVRECYKDNRSSLWEMVVSEYSLLRVRILLNNLRTLLCNCNVHEDSEKIHSACHSIEFRVSASDIQNVMKGQRLTGYFGVM